MAILAGRNNTYKGITPGKISERPTQFIMNSSVLFKSIILAIFLAAIFVIAEPLQPINRSIYPRKNSTSSDSGPCDCACDIIKDTLKNCSHSDDPFCRCDLWSSKSVPSFCASCVAIHPDSKFNHGNFGIIGFQMKQSFCQCQHSCQSVAKHYTSLSRVFGLFLFYFFR